MNRKLWTLSAAVFASLGLVAGCSSEPTVSVKEGWRNYIHSRAAIDLNAGIDRLTGEIAVSGSGGLKLRDEQPDDESLEVAIAEQKAEACERYIDDESSGSYDSQSLLIDSVMIEMMMAGNAKIADDSSRWLKQATEDVEAYMDRVAGSLDGISYTSDRYDGIRNARNNAHKAWWEVQDPELIAQYEESLARERAMWQSIRHEDTVAALHKLIVAECDIEVPASYHFRTGEEMGITMGLDD